MIVGREKKEWACIQACKERMNPGGIIGYTAYRLFFLVQNQPLTSTLGSPTVVYDSSQGRKTHNRRKKVDTIFRSTDRMQSGEHLMWTKRTGPSFIWINYSGHNTKSQQ